MSLISMASLVYVLEQIPSDVGMRPDPDADAGDGAIDPPTGGFVDPSLPPYWGHVAPLPSCRALPRFASHEDFMDRIGTPPTWYPQNHYARPPAAPGSNGPDYSTTNNQVEGVDEADIVKTDGEYLYTAQGSVIGISRAYPPERAGLIVRIPFPANIVGLFVNGDRLVVIGSAYANIDGVTDVTRVQVLDTADPRSPRIAHDVALGGWYLGSRMIGEHVYIAARGEVYNGTDGYLLPWIWTDGTRDTLSYEDIGVLPGAEKSSSLTLLMALRITGDDPAGCLQAVQSPRPSWQGGTMYVSAAHIYLARWASWWSDPNRVEERSTIHRFAIDSGGVEYTGSSDVPGTILNQFAMDERNGYFRVVTSLWDRATNVYVLDPSLAIVGRLEGLAPGETFHSARFLGDRVYLVTFKKIDPFFVVDLATPATPVLLGVLKIPGYSDYLHPYDENHIIGLGKDTHDMGGFAWYQGVKLSLFDVTDVANPREISTLVIGDRGTESEAIRDHRAFLFDRDRGLLVLPIDLALIDRDANPDPPPQTYGTPRWQGAYVISLGLGSEFELAAIISHENFEAPPTCYNRYVCDPYRIRRSLFIEDYLYTVSASAIGVTDIDSFKEVARVLL